MESFDEMASGFSERSKFKSITPQDLQREASKHSTYDEPTADSIQSKISQSIGQPCEVLSYKDGSGSALINNVELAFEDRGGLISFTDSYDEEPIRKTFISHRKDDNFSGHKRDPDEFTIRESQEQPERATRTSRREEKSEPRRTHRSVPLADEKPVGAKSMLKVAIANYGLQRHQDLILSLCSPFLKMIGSEREANSIVKVFYEGSNIGKGSLGVAGTQGLSQCLANIDQMTQSMSTLSRGIQTNGNKLDKVLEQGKLNNISASGSPRAVPINNTVLLALIKLGALARTERCSTLVNGTSTKAGSVYDDGVRLVASIPNPLALAQKLHTRHT